MRRKKFLHPSSKSSTLNKSTTAAAASAAQKPLSGEYNMARGRKPADPNAPQKLTPAEIVVKMRKEETASKVVLDALDEIVQQLAGARSEFKKLNKQFNALTK
jgi:hypothetical protein